MSDRDLQQYQAQIDKDIAAYAAGFAAGQAAQRAALLDAITELDVPFAEGVQGEHGKGYLDALRDCRRAIRDAANLPAPGDGERP